MITARIVREDLKDIRYYFSRKDFFEKVYSKVGENTINEKIDKFNDVVRFAFIIKFGTPIKLQPPFP